MSKIDPLHKRLLRFSWRVVQSCLALLASPDYRGGVKVWYGGARAGSIGGPLVKVKRLRKFFPEYWFGYNLVYTLSNTPYLSPLALRLLKLHRVPLVLNQNGVFYSAWFDGDWKKKNEQMARAYHAADYVLWQSQFCKDCADRFLGVRQGAGEILFNAVDIEHYKPAEQLCEGPPTFLLTGKVDNHVFYRVEATIRGFAEAQQKGLGGRLIIAGWMAVEACEKTLALCEDLGVREFVELTGAYRQEDAPAIYQSADVYVMLKHNDPCPNTVLEALSCGLPVLHSASGGVPELAKDNAGLALPVTQGFEKSYLPDNTTIAEGMFQILEDLPVRRVDARLRAEEAFDLKRWVARHDEIFGQLLSD